jgi:hypothetical protein
LNFRDQAFSEVDRDFTLPPAFVANPEATLTRGVFVQSVNFALTNNAETIFRHILD